MADTTGSVKVVGLATLVRTMRKAGEDLTDLKAANDRAAQIVIGEAAATAPRRTGRLAGTLRASRTPGRARIMLGRASVPYAGPIHWGWPARNIAAQSFVSEAARATEATWVPVYAAAVQDALDHVVGA